MVEAISNGIEDKLIDGLSFKMNHGASYVVDRRSVTFHPQGSNIYKTREGTKLIRILLTGDNWMDPSTLRILFQLNNDEAAAEKLLRPLSGPHAFFRRMRILVAGQLVEDIDRLDLSPTGEGPTVGPDQTGRSGGLLVSLPKGPLMVATWGLDVPGNGCQRQ